VRVEGRGERRGEKEVRVEERGEKEVRVEYWDASCSQVNSLSQLLTVNPG